MIQSFGMTLPLLPASLSTRMCVCSMIKSFNWETKWLKMMTNALYVIISDNIWKDLLKSIFESESFLFNLTVLTLSILISAQPGPCEQYPGYEMTQWGCIKYHDVRHNYCDASKICKKEGGRLISTDSFTTRTDYNALCLSKSLHFNILIFYLFCI